MTKHLDRREFIQLAGLTTAAIAGVVFSSGLRGVSYAAAKGKAEDFMFLQMSDLHWGFTGPAVNPDAEVTLDKAIAHVNALPRQPDFIAFTADLTHTTDDPQERRKRLAHVRDAVTQLKVKTHHYLPGEHDASLDQGEAFKEFFGKTHYTFDHKGVHFIVLDNVSDPKGMLGDEQLEWLRADLKKLDKDAPIVVLTHPRCSTSRPTGTGRRPTVPRRSRRSCRTSTSPFLWAHPPGAPPDDRPHPAPCGEGADVCAAGAAFRAQEYADSVGRRGTLPGPRLPLRPGEGRRAMTTRSPSGQSRRPEQ